jgi:hypothetical protein
MKDFTQEIYTMFNRLKNGQPFSFSKYADGEWAIIQGHHLNNGEFEFSPQTISFYREKLIESFKYKNKNYYVGISCSCCQGNESQKMIGFSEQDADHLTFANIFVNTNYPIYLETFIKQYKNHDVHLIANKNSKIENLPFKIEKFYPVGFSAWTNDYNLIDQIKQTNLSNKLFLFCTGIELSCSLIAVPTFNARGYVLDMSNVAIGVIVLTPIFPLMSVPNKYAFPELPRYK